jgi:SPX domain protein involved in polyphosphate accumulation
MSALPNRLARLEFKYLLDEATAGRICRELEPYCSLDAYGANARHTAHSPASSYPVRSLYLDSPTFDFHRAKERGDPERFKLRVRGYDKRQVLYLEIKHRSGDFVHKQRIGIDPRNLVEAGHETCKLDQETPQGRRVAEEFGRRVLSTAASPKLLIRYDRVAYGSQVDQYARVTFDRNIEFQKTEQWNMEGQFDIWSGLQRQLIDAAPNPLVIMEIKTLASIPHWLIDIVRRHSLQRSSVSKYSLGIYLNYRFRYLSPGRERARGLLN